MYALARVLVFTLACLFFTSEIRAVVPVHLWSKRIGNNLNESGEAVAVDPSGNIFVTGTFRGVVDFGGGPLSSAGVGDIFVAKYDANSTHQWSRTFGSTLNDDGFAIAADASGNVIIAGSYEGTVDFGGGPLTSAGFRDIFVAKYDPSGAHVWSRRFGGVSDDAGYGVGVDALGNIVIAGRFINSVNLGGGPIVVGGINDIFIAKYDAGGAHQWSMGFMSNDTQHGTDVAVNPAGNIVMTGSFEGTVNFGSGSLTSVSANDVFVATYNPSGSGQWSQRFGGTNRDIAYGAAIDAFGNVVITGFFTNSIDFGGGPLTSAGAADIFVAGFSPIGAHQWSRRFGNTETDVGNGVAINGAGVVAVTGRFRVGADFGGGSLSSAGLNDVFLATYDSGGAHRWSQRFGNTSGDVGLGIAFDASADLIATGSFQRTVDFGGGPLTSVGGEDVFIAKFRDDNPVPVLITNFEANPVDAGIQVRWELWSDETLEGLALYRRDRASSETIAVAQGLDPSTHSFVDQSVFPGTTYDYELVVYTHDGGEFRSPIVTAQIPSLTTSLDQNVPNPFNPETSIPFSLSREGRVSLRVYDTSGRFVATLLDENRTAGEHVARWDGLDARGRAPSSGIYFARLQANGVTETRKLVLLK